MTLSTHVLDAVLGRPAAGVPVRLDVARPDGWFPVARERTDADGRIRFAVDLLGGPHRLIFDTAAYFRASGVAEFFYPEVAIAFVVTDPDAHHHVPLLLSPFAYSTYRGS
jgi:5-hydroxyisourate hydrolase